MTIIETEVHDLFEKLVDAYDEYKPNDEDYLEENEELVEQMVLLDGLSPTTEEDYKMAIGYLCSFLHEWFPDSVDEEEQRSLVSLMTKGNEYRSK